MTRKYPHIYRSEGRASHIMSFKEKAEPFIKKMTAREIRPNSGEHTSRILNHWTKLGLIDENREGEKGWRKFNPLEIVWLEMIKEMRSFGFPNDKILLVKQHIIDTNKGAESISDSLMMQYYVGLVLSERVSSFLLIYENGEASFTTYQDLILSEKIFQTPSHIRISINSILQKLYPDQELWPTNDNMYQLEKEERELLIEIRLNPPKSIEVKLKNGKITDLNIETEDNGEKRLHEILKEGDYQDITLRKRDGKIVHIKQKIRKRMTKT